MSRYRVRNVPARRVAVGVGLAILAVILILALRFGGVAALTLDASEYAVSLLEQYGYPALLSVFVLEGLMVLYFAPSESLVPAAVFALGRDPLSILILLVIAVVGATLGQVALFVLVRRVGREGIVERGWIGVSHDDLERFDQWFRRWGPLAVPASNAMPFVRGMLTVPAGLSDMRLSTFTLLSAAGTLCFQVVLVVLTLGLLGSV
ncbi:MAG: DedA family protein [Salinirussus sp.]